MKINAKNIILMVLMLLMFTTTIKYGTAISWSLPPPLLLYSSYSVCQADAQYYSDRGRYDGVDVSSCSCVQSGGNYKIECQAVAGCTSGEIDRFCRGDIIYIKAVKNDCSEYEYALTSCTYGCSNGLCLNAPVTTQPIGPNPLCYPESEKICKGDNVYEHKLNSDCTYSDVFFKNCEDTCKNGECIVSSSNFKVKSINKVTGSFTKGSIAFIEVVVENTGGAGEIFLEAGLYSKKYINKYSLTMTATKQPQSCVKEEVFVTSFKIQSQGNDITTINVPVNIPYDSSQDPNGAYFENPITSVFGMNDYFNTNTKIVLAGLYEECGKGYVSYLKSSNDLVIQDSNLIGVDNQTIDNSDNSDEIIIDNSNQNEVIFKNIVVKPENRELMIKGDVLFSSAGTYFVGAKIKQNQNNPLSWISRTTIFDDYVGSEIHTTDKTEDFEFYLTLPENAGSYIVELVAKNGISDDSDVLQSSEYTLIITEQDDGTLEYELQLPNKAIKTNLTYLILGLSSIFGVFMFRKPIISTIKRVL